MYKSYIDHKTYNQTAQNHEQTQYPLLSDGQHTLPNYLNTISNPNLELLKVKLSSLKEELANIELQNALLNKRRGIKHAVAFLLGI